MWCGVVFSSEDHFAEFADGAIAAVFGEVDNAWDGFDYGYCVGWTCGYACVLEEVKVIDIITYKADILQGDAQLLANLVCGLEFGHLNAVYYTADTGIDIFQTKFLSAFQANGSVLAGEDTTRDTRFAQEHNAHAVIYAETFELVTALGVVHTAVGHATVHVGEK